MLGWELTIQLVVLRLLAGLIIFTAHGVTIAVVAVLLGDKGPQYDGRLTALPFKHIDLIGLASMMYSGFGWSRFVAIESDKLRFGRWGLVIAVLAGSAVLLVIGYLFLFLIIPALTMLPYTAGITAAAFVRVAARLCVWSALFALIPLPPLAGAHFVAALGIRLPKQTGLILGIALLAASAFGLTRWALTPAYDLIAPLVLGAELGR